MLKFLKKTETTFFSKVANVALAYVFLAVWTILVIKFYNWLFELTNYSGWQFEGYNPYKRPMMIEFFLAVIAAPLWEEIVFRKFPLDIARSVGKEKLLIPIMLFTSVIFGLGHYGIPSLLLQGVAGFVMSMLYIKNGYSYWSSVALHALWNASLMFGFLNI